VTDMVKMHIVVSNQVYILVMLLESVSQTVCHFLIVVVCINHVICRCRCGCWCWLWKHLYNASFFVL